MIDYNPIDFVVILVIYAIESNEIFQFPMNFAKDLEISYGKSGNPSKLKWKGDLTISHDEAVVLGTL